jgi:hypothetical protein
VGQAAAGINATGKRRIKLYAYEGVVCDLITGSVVRSGGHEATSLFHIHGSGLAQRQRSRL